MTSSQSEGYSLLELVIVMAVIALITASSVPMFSRHNTPRTTDDVLRSLGQVFSDARAKALTSRKEVLVRVVFTPDVLVQVDGLPKVTDIPRKLKVTAVSAKSLNAEKNVAYFRFLPTGGSTGGSITVSDGLVQKSLYVDWLTGNWASNLDRQK